MLKELLAKGAEVDAADPTHGSTALHFVAFKAHDQCVQILLNAKADINAKVRNKPPCCIDTQSHNHTHKHREAYELLS